MIKNENKIQKMNDRFCFIVIKWAKSGCKRYYWSFSEPLIRSGLELGLMKWIRPMNWLERKLFVSFGGSYRRI